MHISHQKYLATRIKGSLAAIETALAAQHEEGESAHPDLAIARKVTILESLDKLHQDLAALEPVLREQNE